MPRFTRYLRRLGQIATAARVTRDWTSLVLAYSNVRKHTYPLRIRLRSGHVVELHDRNEAAVLWNVLVNACYRVRPTDRTIVDAGANIGIFALTACQQAPAAEVWSIEAYPPTYERLVRTIAENRLHERVRPLLFALTAGNGTRPMLVAATSSADRGLMLAASQEKALETVDVPARSLESFIGDVPADEIDFLKMDIEGAEHETLHAAPRALLRRFRRMDVEIHEVNAALHHTPERLIRHIESAGFRLVEYQPDVFRTGIARFDRDDLGGPARTSKPADREI